MTENLPAQVVKQWTDREITLIKSIAAPKCTEEEFSLLLYLAKTYQLDPLARQIWAVKYDPGQPARIFAGRDGYLAFAHRSGQFDGMITTIEGEGDSMVATCRVYRKDMQHPTEVSVDFREYNKRQGNWLTMPRTMLKKVAESQALRKAFDISGIYSPEEFPEPEKPAPKDITPPAADPIQDHEGKVLIKDPKLGDVWVDDKSHKKKK